MVIAGIASLDLIARERAATWRIEQDFDQISDRPELSEATEIEARITLTGRNPAEAEGIQFQLGNEGAGWNRIYTNALKMTEEWERPTRDSTARMR